jgi:hypothetical protein
MQQSTILTDLRSRGSVTRMLHMDELPAWSVLTTAQSASSQTTWFLGGTTEEWKGAPLVFSLVIEGNDPNGAHKIGHEMMKSMLVP